MMEGKEVNDLERIGVVLSLLEGMEKEGSWCGETHIQKATYLLQELADIPLGYEFILYKHGPFSFDFRNELSNLKADGLITLKTQPYPYGPSMRITSLGEMLISKFTDSVSPLKGKIDFISQKLSHMKVGELERIATALLVTLKSDSKNIEQRADGIILLKSHVSKEEAIVAINNIDEMRTICPR